MRQLLNPERIAFICLLIALGIVICMQSCENDKLVKDRDAAIDKAIEGSQLERAQNKADRDSSKTIEERLKYERDSIASALASVDRSIIVIEEHNEETHRNIDASIDTAGSAFIDEYWARELDAYRRELEQ